VLLRRKSFTGDGYLLIDPEVLPSILPDDPAEITARATPKPRIRIGRHPQKGPRKSGAHLRGNSLEEGTSPAVIAARARFRMNFVNRTAAENSAKSKKSNETRRQRDLLSKTLEDALQRRVEIDGKPTNLTVAQAIIKHRMEDAMDSGELGLETTKFVFDRLEGKPKVVTEISGPEGGPIETVETSVVLAKLFS
jgi:hypothetical protein